MKLSRTDRCSSSDRRCVFCRPTWNRIWLCCLPVFALSFISRIPVPLCCQIPWRRRRCGNAGGEADSHVFTQNARLIIDSLVSETRTRTQKAGGLDHWGWTAAAVHDKQRGHAESDLDNDCKNVQVSKSELNSPRLELYLFATQHKVPSCPSGFGWNLLFSETPGENLLVGLQMWVLYAYKLTYNSYYSTFSRKANSHKSCAHLLTFTHPPWKCVWTPPSINRRCF